MRFEIRETVQTPDPEIVLRALEMCSREVSNDVERYGDRITLRGLGPSPRSRNRHDMTVFCVNAENDEIVIQGEVNFQASALLGDMSQQDVVKSKLDDLFEQMKAQIHLDTLRISAYSAARRSAAATATVVADRPAEAAQTESYASVPVEEEIAPPVAPETWIEALDTEPHSIWAAAALLTKPELVTEPEEIAELSQTAEPEEVTPSASILAPELKEEPASEVISEKTPKPEAAIEPALAVEAQSVVQPKPLAVAPAAVAPLVDEPRWVAKAPPVPEVREHRSSASKQIALWVIALAVLLTSVGGTYLSYRSRRGTSTPPAQVVAQAPVATEDAVPAVDTATPAKTAATPGSGVEPGTSGPELKQWLQSWAASMRTRDANAQAAFYADTLDRYLNQRNVGREVVLRDREATNRMRKGLWTVKMEDVVIDRKTSSQADVRLVKHFIDETEQSEIQESFVPTRLTLKHIDGQWKITSEQDLPALSVTPWSSKK